MKQERYVLVMALVTLVVLGLPAFAQTGELTSVNTPPVVSAGTGQTIALPAGANLSGTVTDDGLPYGTLYTDWSQVSGPGSVNLLNEHSLNTATSFSVAGTYVLRLTATDGARSDSADVTIIVNSGETNTNTAPVVNAGVGQTITLPAGANLSGTVTDDGLPYGTLYTDWSQVSGPGSVNLLNERSLNTVASFSVAGTYVLRLTATDGARSDSADVTIIVNLGATNTNTAPVVNAGEGQTIALPAGANLTGTVTDDGLPYGTLYTDWSSVGGPGSVNLLNERSLNTVASFSVAGTYVLRLTATDGARSDSADVTIIVNSGATNTNTNTNFAPQVVVQPVDKSFSVMTAALGLQGQPNWVFYNGGDAPEGAYMGWLWQAQTLMSTVRLPRQLSPGRYYMFFYGITYDCAETIQASIGGGTSTSVALNDRDASRYWSDRVVIDVATASDSLQLKLTRDPSRGEDQRYLFRGIYITDHPDETMSAEGSTVKLVYPTVMDDSAPVKGNLVPNGGFETPVDASWGFPGEGGGRLVSINTMWESSQGHGGQGSFKFPFDPATSQQPTNWGQEFISRVYHLKPNKRYTVSMWVKASPGMSTSVTLSLVNTYVPPDGYAPQHSVSAAAVPVGDTWRRLSLTGYLLEYPTTDYQIHVLTGGPSGTYLLVDDVQLEEGDLTNFSPAAPVEAGVFIDMTAKPANIFYTDEFRTADLVVRNNGSASASKTVRYEIYDQLNAIIAQGSVPLTLPALSTQRLPFDLSVGGKQGTFRIVTWVENEDRTEKELVYAVIPRPLTTTSDPTSFVGIHGTYSEAQLKTLQRLGIKWNRVSSPSTFCRWSMVEPLDNQFVWSDAEVIKGNAHGIATMCTIGNNHDWPAWADNGGLPNLAKWQEFVSQLVSHYKPYIKHWEIWNESYKAFSPDFYAQMLKLATDAIEAADPSAVIIGLGGSPPSSIQPVITALQTRYPTWDWRQHIDVLATHDYPDGISPEDLKPFIDTYGVQVWNTETGATDLGFYQGVNSNFVSWGKNAWPNADAARYYQGMTGASVALTENFLRTIASGQTKYFYYDSRLSIAANYFKQHVTMIEHDGTIRTKGISYAIAASLIDHSVGLGNASSDPSSYVLVFDKPGGPVASLFTSDRKVRQITIPLSPSQFEVLDVMGNRLTGSGITFGRIPVYLKGIGISAATLKAALQAAVITMSADTTPPNLSISDAPRGPIADHGFRVRWIALDDTSYPNLGGEIDSKTGLPTESANPNALQYAYYLSGYSASWSSWYPGNYVDFSNVPSGSYTFSVVAKDMAGNQSAVVSRPIVIN